MELLPCPFCGGKRITKRRNGIGWYIGCNDCDLGFSMLEDPDDRWNTRAPDPRATRLINAARRYLNTGFRSARGELRAALEEFEP